VSGIGLGVAIVGSGMIGAVHARAARLAGARLIGVAASEPSRSEQAAARLGAGRGYDSAEQAIADPAVDVVHICTPNATHLEFALAALKAGKGVICEKPLATTAADARLLVQTARESGRVATVPFVYRFHPMVREARARIHAAELGPLQLIHGSYLQDWLLDSNDTNWRVDAAKGGASRAFADIGSHWCDLIEWVSGERLVSVIAALNTTVPERPGCNRQSYASAAQGEAAAPVPVTTEDVAGALFKTHSGVLVNLTVSQVSAGRKNRLWFEIDGAQASVVFDQEEPERLWLARTRSTELLVRDPNTGSAEQRRLATLPPGHAQGYAQCFEAFVADTYAAVRGETRDGLPTFDDGLRSANIIEAVLKSSATQRWTAIEPEPRAEARPRSSDRTA
jgi:predicted dehydrogenase